MKLCTAFGLAVLFSGAPAHALGLWEDVDSFSVIDPEVTIVNSMSINAQDREVLAVHRNIYAYGENGSHWVIRMRDGANSEFRTVADITSDKGQGGGPYTIKVAPNGSILASGDESDANDVSMWTTRLSDTNGE